ncbi:hypothetical protein [Bifidobacterium sp. SO4]|uniref:hypothetical protein n=1 Tax=Bifidobacterium sp. SO4 TaxID=2809030 RepID=UPI001BDD926C|nr:hypothetical protein [Bifidobacterium sp. SO4]MBT1171260.1 hypothetical protein [Bifidobacterium sp. SO4]
MALVKTSEVSFAPAYEARAVKGKVTPAKKTYQGFLYYQELPVDDWTKPAYDNGPDFPISKLYWAFVQIYMVKNANDSTEYEFKFENLPFNSVVYSRDEIVGIHRSFVFDYEEKSLTITVVPSMLANDNANMVVTSFLGCLYQS